MTNPRRNPGRRAEAPWPVVIAAACGMLAAFVAAGSTGFLVTPLRHAMVGLLLAAAFVALRPSWRQLALVLVVAASGVVLSLLAGGLLAVDALAVAAVLATMALGATGPARRVVTVVATAASALALVRAACFMVPAAWWADGAIGYVMGRLGGLIGGRSLWVGPSLAGLDLVLVMVVFLVAWLRATPPPRAGRAARAALAIAVVQAVYLLALSHAAELAAALPETPMPESFDPGEYRPTDWSVLAELRVSFPWSLPLAGAVLQTLVAAAMLRWSPLDVSDAEVTAADGSIAMPEGPGRGRARALLAASVVVAALTAVLGSLSPAVGNLSDKTVLAYNRGFVDWIAPAHDVLDPIKCGTYGLLPALVADLGGQWLTSNDLSKEELEKADVVVVIHPTERLPEDCLKRLEEYVRGGGSLLVVAGPIVETEALAGAAARPEGKAVEEAEEKVASGQDLRPVNDLLRPVGMAVCHDAALSPADAWMGAAAGSTHPAVFGLSDRTLALSLRQGATIKTRWPARPILIGRWGWSEPGVVPLWSDGGTVDPGEKWGDLLLAAERPWGRGTVVALGDYWSLTNLGVADGHDLAGRLLGYLANRPSNPQTMWRSALASLGFLFLLGLVVWQPSPVRLVAIGLTLGAVLAVAMWQASQSGPIPGLAAGAAGSEHSRPVAYLDTSHLEVGNHRPWANDATDGLQLTLARNGYLPLKMERWDPRRLERAKLLIVMAPARPFAAAELRQMREFVERGGCLVCMVGATEAAANRGLLAEFGFEVRPSPSPTGTEDNEAEPIGQFPDRFGRFRTIYLDAAQHGRGSHKAHVWFLQAWPVACTAKEGQWQRLAIGYGEQPIAVHRWLGKGSAVLVGDSRFGLNFVHGYYEGQVSESAQENDDFWRWMLSVVVERNQWIPPERTKGAPSDSSRSHTEVMR